MMTCKWSVAVNRHLCVVTDAAAAADDDDDRSVFCFDGFASFGVDVVDCGVGTEPRELMFAV